MMSIEQDPVIQTCWICGAAFEDPRERMKHVCAFKMVYAR